MMKCVSVAKMIWDLLFKMIEIDGVFPAGVELFSGIPNVDADESQLMLEKWFAKDLCSKNV